MGDAQMIDIGFYQLAQRRAEAVLPQLVTKALAAGHRLLITAPDSGQLERLDAALWDFSPDSFVPHGLALALDAGGAATQPVLLAPDCDWSINAADCLVQIGGDLPDDLAGLTRVLFLFDAENLETARARWRVVAKADAVRPAYWRENDKGRFEKAA
jgi:DNA polymerase-3 subunit chi